MHRRLLQPVWLALLCLTVHGAASAQSSTPEAAQRPVTWLIFVDDLHLDFRNTGRIRDAIRRLASELVKDGDRFAIASSGPSSLAVPLTSDRQALGTAIKTTIGNALRFSDIMQSASSVEVLYRASTAVAAAQSMLASFSDAPEWPTAMLYVSNGYSFDLLQDPAPGAPQRIRGRNFTRAGVHEQLAELTATAARTSVRIFAINPRMGLDLDDPTTAPTDPVWSAHRLEMQRVLRSLSEDSGGFALLDGELVPQLGRIANTMRR